MKLDNFTCARVMDINHGDRNDPNALNIKRFVGAALSGTILPALFYELVTRNGSCLVWLGQITDDKDNTLNHKVADIEEPFFIGCLVGAPANVSFEDAYLISTSQRPSFWLFVEDVFSIEGRGTVATGYVSWGSVRVGDDVLCETLNSKKRVRVLGLEQFRKLIDEAHEGDSIGILLRDVKKNEIPKGTILRSVDSVRFNNFNRAIGDFRLIVDGEEYDLMDSHEEPHEEGSCNEDDEVAGDPLSEELTTTDCESIDSLIGLTPVKCEIKKLANFVRVQNARKQNGMKVVPVSYHCVFTGNPGTGKTTVARILAGIYRELGVLKKGHLVETDRSGLVAEYVGQTAIKTNKIIDSALDGILFIDEAYSLVDGGDSDYGKEAISTLLKRMEDDRDRLVVILAGYTDDMKRFIDSNPGLQSRFNRYIEFPDYSANELALIFDALVGKNQYICDDEAHQCVQKILESVVATKDKSFGNGRFVRNLFEKVIERQATRIATEGDMSPEALSKIMPIDVCD